MIDVGRCLLISGTVPWSIVREIYTHRFLWLLLSKWFICQAIVSFQVWIWWHCPVYVVFSKEKTNYRNYCIDLFGFTTNQLFLFLVAVWVVSSVTSSSSESKMSSPVLMQDVSNGEWDARCVVEGGSDMPLSRTGSELETNPTGILLQSSERLDRVRLFPKQSSHVCTIELLMVRESELCQKLTYTYLSREGAQLWLNRIPALHQNEESLSIFI